MYHNKSLERGEFWVMQMQNGMQNWMDAVRKHSTFGL